MIGPSWQNEVTELQQHHPGLHIVSAGGYCPFQAEGTLHGYPFYFRARSGSIRLVVGHGDLWFMPMWAADRLTDDPDVQPATLVTLMSALIGDLRRAEIWWEFPGITDTDIGQLPAGSATLYGQWGRTAEHAWQRLREVSPWLTDRGIDEQQQAAMWDARQVRPETVTVDTRVFPTVDPFDSRSDD